MSANVKVGLLGICPACEGEFKVRDGKLVHHGFTRPGDGQIHGDCFAVGYEPYQRSTKGCEDYKAVIETRLADLEKFLNEIPARTYWSELVVKGWSRSEIETRQYVLGVTDRYTWERFVDNKTRETEYAIRQCKSEIARMERLIGAWSLKDLREVTEEVAAAQVKAQRDARAAERAAKKAEKDAKAAALKAKRDARDAKREAAFTAFVEKLQAIAASPEGEKEKTAAARTEWYAFFSKKTKRELGDLTDFYYAFRKRGLEPLLVSLGAASNDSRGWVSYHYSING